MIHGNIFNISLDATAIRDIMNNMNGYPRFAQGREGLRRLSAILRNMPPWYRWDFAMLSTPGYPPGRCGCAIGLARVLWPEFRAIGDQGDTPPRAMRLEADAFGMKVKHYRAIFGMLIADDWIYGDNRSAGDVEPQDVADAIDRYLVEGRV